jgi:transcriptional regulator with XRE-family HTH domain
MTRFQELIKNEMTQKRIKLIEVAERAGIRRATVSDFLRGKADIRVSTLEKILKALEL